MQVNKDWHNQASDETLAALGTTLDGLSEDEAARRLQTFGPNKLPERAQRHIVLRFLSHFHNILIYVLIGAASITALLGHVVDTFVIIAVVIINAVIGFYQEGKAEKAMEAIRQMLALRASVIRDGKRQVIPGRRQKEKDALYRVLRARPGGVAPPRDPVHGAGLRFARGCHQSGPGDFRSPVEGPAPGGQVPGRVPGPVLHAARDRPVGFPQRKGV